MRRFFQKFLIFNSILLSILIFGNVAKACNCLPTETVDKEFARTPNVVILKLQSVIQNEGEAASYYLSVEKVFKGELKVDETLVFKYGSNCSWLFSENEIGTEYLLYLGERPANNEMWSGYFCARSGRINSRTADLSYLENENKLRDRTRLSGTLRRTVETPDEVQRFSINSLATRKIRITGNGRTIKLVTDENGVYEIYDLPAGKYRISPEQVEGFIFSSDRRKYTDVEIKSKSHTEQDFFYEINNEISGKIIDLNGKPLGNICVDLISVKTQKLLGSFHQSCTNPKGEFELTAIPAGTYKIVINRDDLADTPNPAFNTFYYPNAKTEEGAAKFSVEANYFLKNLILVPPEMIETITLTGRLIFSDGKPVANETIQFLKGDEIFKSSDDLVFSDFETETDKMGQFRIIILKGNSGILRGILYSYSGKFENCPSIAEILKRKEDKIQQIETAKLEVLATDNMTGIELKFPFPSCKKAKNE
jgi:hypothetical protein